MEIEQPINGMVHLPTRIRGNFASKHFRQIHVSTNHYRVQLDPFQALYIFKVNIEPRIEADSRNMIAKVLKEALPAIKRLIEQPVITGMNIYTIKRPLGKQGQYQAGQYKVRVKQVKVYQMKECPKLLLHFLNSGLRNIMKNLDYVQIGRSCKYFSQRDRKTFDNLMMFNGYKSNFVLLENGFYLRVDSTKKIVRSQTALMAIDNVYRAHQDKQKQEKRSLVEAELVGKIVMANYGRTRYYRIEEIVYRNMSEEILEGTDGLTIKRYYEKKYELTITNPRQPLLKAENKQDSKEILLIPQFCLMTGIPEEFDQFKRKQISQQTIKSPAAKLDEIRGLMKDMRSTEHFSTFQNLGIHIKKDLEKIAGRIIPCPKLVLGDNNAVQEGKEAFFNLFNKPIYSNKHSIRCAIVHFQSCDIRPMISTFQSTSRNLNVKLETLRLNGGDYEPRKALQVIENMIRKAVNKQECNVCCVVIPNNLKSQYSRIKVSSLINSGVICQVVTQGCFRKKNAQSIFTKVLLQIIAKRGNTLWVPESNHQLTDTMMAAFDKAKTQSGKYVMGICVTVNSTFSSIFSKSEQFEECSKMSVMVGLQLESIGAYVRRNKKLPSKIIIFHNSCSNDQITIFQEHFIQPLRSKIQEIYNESVPSLTFIMVNTKTSQRFFKEAGQVRNVDAGTLISSSLVSEFYDFYLISQYSSRGASLPNHYKVIYNDSKMEEGVLQDLIFGQCFNYVNWTGSIKVPGILQYAKKCARFNAEVLNNSKINQDMQNKLYFV